MSHNTEEWCKIWEGIYFCFEKWHGKFSEFWPNTRESQNVYFKESSYDYNVNTMIKHREEKIKTNATAHMLLEW